MSSLTANRPKAALDLALWQARANGVSNADVYLRLSNAGLPSEAAIRLKELMGATRQIGGKVIDLGKIVVLKLMDFMEQHPNLTAGMALGAAVSALAASVPVLGPLLAPLALAVGLAIGAVVGHRMDKSRDGTFDQAIGVMEVTQDVIEIARAFFKLFADTLQALFGGDDDGTETA